MWVNFKGTWSYSSKFIFLFHSKKHHSKLQSKTQGYFKSVWMHFCTVLQLPILYCDLIWIHLHAESKYDIIIFNLILCTQHLRVRHCEPRHQNPDLFWAFNTPHSVLNAIHSLSSIFLFFVFVFCFFIYYVWFHPNFVSVFPP